MIRCCIAVIIMICALSCTSRTAAVGYRYDTYETGGGWGYMIYHNDRVLIKQPVVPVVTGNHPFREKEQAGRAAALVVTRLQAGQPPALTRSDINSLQLGENP